ncbi:DUF938 domain-containing protein [Sphingomonas astaxanthinifaciens]|uniref:SAM-dependent methyltransferase n=1 Tax=Sphingomonas astaxanthinifaciens DSM 22298 TaxID=1123267 RepID=A0ABQ5Z778_9SPHN|nr:SAM-dependent methyltransferase [Sphingomonas astaxanthinifaciens DSM 22298]
MKRTAPAASRNRDPILAVLREWLPASGLVLEVASGTGEHAIAFAAAFPNLDWQPSDPDPEARESIAAWRAEEGTPNLRPPLALDVASDNWPVTEAAAIVAINLVHISPPEASIGLLDGAARLLAPGAPLILYGPWRVRGEPLVPSNLAFDAALKERDPRYGLRELTSFAAEARDRGLVLAERRAMPANNLSLRFVRAG